MSRWAWVLGAVLVVACARPRPASPPRTTSLGLAISTSTLTNGLRVVLVADPRAPDLQVTMRYRVGALNDPPGKEGMAHLVEHLMFEQQLGSQSIFARLEERAASFNAFTSHDATTYVTRAHPSRLDELLSIESVRVGLRCVSITDAVFEREREVVRNELIERDYATQLYEAVLAGLYPDGHAYRRPIGGRPDGVGAITKDEACAFADHHYTPGNAVLVVSGALDARQLEASLGKFLARVPARPTPAPVAVKPADGSRRSEVTAPIDDRAIVLAWPLPPEAVMRARVRALRDAVSAAIDARIGGTVAALELGDLAAPMMAFAISPAEKETTEDILAAAAKATEDLAKALGSDDGPWARIAFHRIQQGGIRHLFAGLEGDGSRDAHLAAYTLAGQDPREMLGAQIRSLRTMTAADAIEVVRGVYKVDAATVVALSPGPRKMGGVRVTAGRPVHDVRGPRVAADPADAHQPSSEGLTASSDDRVVTRELANGLDVVLLPITSVPTVEARLVFRAGTADEPTDARGAALVAGHALSWNFRYVEDLLAFSEGGGGQGVEVSTDDTAFVVRGLDMHLDYVLTGLRRYVLDGKIDRDVLRVVRELRVRAQTTEAHDLDAAEDAWRTALYGDGHPYQVAGLYRHLAPTLSVTDAQRFRRQHFTPDNATLVIAGRFDPEIAERWIEHLFGSWSAGDAKAAAAQAIGKPAAPRPAAFAVDDDTAQLLVWVSLPSRVVDRARQLVAKAMLAEIAGDVRQELGASYGLGARLVERRLARTYELSGWIDAARAPEAVALLQARLAALRDDPDAAARTFVRARRRVLSSLASITRGATAIAERVQHDVTLGRRPLDDVSVASTVQDLTVDRLGGVLADLDLARAVIVMRGPSQRVDEAFAALGRTPERVSAATTSALDDGAPGASPEIDEDALYEDQLSPDHPPRRVTFGASWSMGGGSLFEGNVSGSALSAHVGYRVTRSNSIGLQLSAGSLSGTYEKPYDPLNGPMTASTKTVEGFVQIAGLDRIMGGGIMGIRFDDITLTGEAMPRSYVSVTCGGYLAVDVLKHRDHRLTLYGRAETEFISTPGLTFFSLGVGYRR